MGKPEAARETSRLMQLKDAYRQTETTLQSLYEEWDRVAAEATNV